MSDELQGKIPEFDEDVLKQYESNFVFGILADVDPGGGGSLVGNLVGFALEDPIKWDFRVSLETAVQFVSRYTADDVHIDCPHVQLMLGDQVVQFSGPFRVVRPKIYDIDNNTRMCTLAIDLVKS
jgi:hypothetical protein